MKYFREVEVPAKAKKLVEDIKKGAFEIKELDPAAIRFAVFKLLREEPGGEELIKKLRKKLEDYRRETG